MKSQPLVSIIVTNYNGKHYLEKCFNSLLNQTYKNIELVMADGGSKDGSVEYMKRYYPKIKLITNGSRVYLSTTNNQGANISKGKYLLFLNNDTISYPYFIEEMVKVAESNYNIGVVCPFQLPYKTSDDEKIDIDQKDIGAGSDIYGYVCMAKTAGHIFYPDAAIFIRHDLFKKIGGFDENFYIYGEDMDICWRVHLMGYKIVPALKAKFRHDSFCSKKFNGRIQTTYWRRALVERQVINKMLKYYSIPTLIWLLPKFFVYYFFEALFFLLIRGNVRMFYQVYIKAVMWNLQVLPATLMNRELIQKIRKKNDQYILSLMYPKYRKLIAAIKLGIPHIT